MGDCGALGRGGHPKGAAGVWTLPSWYSVSPLPVHMCGLFSSGPVFLDLILLDVSREVPRPLQASLSHPPTPCRLAYGLNPGPERLRQPVWTSMSGLLDF